MTGRGRPEPWLGPVDEVPPTTSRSGLLVGLGVGLPVMGYAVGGALVDADDTHPAELARWVVGLALAHDLLLVPLVLAAAVLLRRVVPGTLWPPVRAGLLASAVLAAVAWPLIRGYGLRASVPSLLPRNYATGLAGALLAVWLVAAVWGAAAWYRARGTGRGMPPGPGPVGRG